MNTGYCQHGINELTCSVCKNTAKVVSTNAHPTGEDAHPTGDKDAHSQICVGCKARIFYDKHLARNRERKRKGWNSKP
jgi:hypothetical protein